MAQEENNEATLLETALAGLESDLLEDVEVEETTEEVVEEATEEVAEESTEDAVEEATVYKVWEEDEEDQEAEEDDDDEKVADDAEDDADEVEVDADDAEDDMEDEAEDEVVGDADDDMEDAEEDMEDDEDEEEAEEAYGTHDEDEDDMEEDEMEDDDTEEDEEESDDVEEDEMEDEEDVDEVYEDEDDVGNAVEQIAKTITAAAAIKAMKKIEAVNDTMKEDIEALCAGDETLSEDFKVKVSTIFEAAVTSKAREQAESLKESFESSVQEEIAELHEGLVDKIDSYLTYVAEQWIQANELPVSNILRTEIAESFMASMKDTFINHYIEMPEGKTDMFDEISQQNSELTESIESKDSEIEKLSEQLVTLERESIVSKLSEGLAATQVSKLKKLSEDITWESAESFEKKVKIIKESYFAKKSTVEETVEEVTEEVDNSQTIEKVTVEEVEPQGSTLDPVMERYIKASVKLQKEAHGDIGKYLQ